MAHGGESRPSGRVVGQKLTGDHEDLVARLLSTITIPDDARTWLLVSFEDGTGEATVRASYHGVQGEFRVPLDGPLLEALTVLLTEHRDAARADLRWGLIRTMTAGGA